MSDDALCECHHRLDEHGSHFCVGLCACDLEHFEPFGTKTMFSQTDIDAAVAAERAKLLAHATELMNNHTHLPDAVSVLALFIEQAKRTDVDWPSVLASIRGAGEVPK